MNLVHYVIIAAMVGCTLHQCIDWTQGCDKRCTCCNDAVTLSNLNCAACNNTFGGYMWLNSDLSGAATSRCETYCPPGQYKDTGMGSCEYCHTYCETCTAYGFTTCSTCATTAFLYNSTTCYNLGNHLWGALSYYNPCVDGTYAWPLTMRCIKCPTGTLTCSLGLEYMMPSTYQSSKTMASGCTNDPDCLYALKSYTCSAALGYIWVQFFCVPINQCREYAYYASTSTTFDAAACTCLPNYYQTGFMSCKRCDISCLTCSYNDSRSCSSCPDGFSLAGGVCSTNGTSDQINSWASNYAANSNELLSAAGSQGTWSATSPTFTTNCGNNTLRYLWGCTGSTCYNGVLTYSIASGLGTDHYGIRVRFVAVFIDNWPSNGAIYITDTTTSSANVFSYNYNSYGVVGQYLCLRNVLDVVQVIDGWWNHTSDALSFDLNNNGPSVGTYYLGIRQMIVYRLKCHSSCATCSSYTENDCTSCPLVGQIVFDWVCQPTAGDCTNLPTPKGQCVCDTGLGYFYDATAGMCVTSCTNNATDFKDKASRQCVATCPQPLPFGDTSDGDRYCKIKCPPNYYKDNRTANKTCLPSCYVNGVAYNLNYYMFNGTDPACFNVCPSGLVADQYYGACLKNCTAAYYNYSGYCLATCPASNYAYNVSNLCVTTCPEGYFKNNKTGTGAGICEYPCTSWGGVKLYGDNSTGSCVNICPNGTYADPSTNMCVKFCNLSATTYMYGQVVKTTIGGVVYWVGTCVTMCTTNFLSTGISYGNPLTGFCVNASDCPINYFGDSATGSTQNMCVETCSNILQYGVNSTKKCETSCGPNSNVSEGFKYNSTKVCVKICPTVPSLFGDEGGYCVSACTGAYFADQQANRTCRLNCSDSPSASFGQNFVCVYRCANVSGNPTWGDPYSSTRACTTNCTYNPATNMSFGYTPLNLCIKECPDTWFGYIQLNGVPICTQTCPLTGYDYFGDNLTNLCTTHCPALYFGDPTGNRLCVKKCADTYFSYQDGTGLRTCETGCPSGYADNLTRVCVLTYVGCGNGTYGDDSDHKCDLPGPNCLNFADPTTQSCVSTCPNDTNTYRYFGDSSTSMCVLICPNYTTTYSLGTFGDNHTHLCEGLCTDSGQVRDYQNNRRCVTEANCSRSPVALFADLVNRICVTAPNCPATTFGDNFTKKCETTCQGPTLLYADPVSKFCVATCPENYYAVNDTSGLGGICNLTCIVPLWADNSTIKCTGRCAAGTYGVSTLMTGGYHIGICEKQCPSGQFARDADNLCVSDCGPGLWGDTSTRFCQISPWSCPSGYYANNISNLCVLPADCQLVGVIQFVADNSTNECVSGCPLTTPRNYADMNKHLCVALCPISYFGENNTLQCLQTCKNPATNVYYQSYADSQLRICVTICSADPTPTYGENDTFTCVEALSCPASTWADDDVYNRQCVPICPPPNTRNANAQKYSDDTTKTCVVTCPWNYYGSMYTGNGVCVSLCDVNTLFADNYSKTCVPTCPSSQGTFGDQNARTCVDVCPINYFAQTPSRYCVGTCRDGTWGETISRVCLTDNTACPIVDKYKQYADNHSHMCVSTCPSSQDTWGQNSTWYCVSGCSTGFKYLPTRVCIDICPLYLNGTGLFSNLNDRTCYATCPLPNYYRDPQASRSCATGCSSSPNNSYADSTTMNCVQTCPAYPVMYYAYDGNWTCMPTCIGGTYVDPTTQKCVNSCPSGYILDTLTNTCVAACPYDSTVIYYADMTQAQPVCVLATACPSTYYGDFNTRLCTQTCTTGLIKQNGTRTCVTFCPDGQYNSSSGYCVIPSNCPTDQYANNLTRSCVTICNGSFADVSNKVCVFTCPVGLYADTYTRICQSNCTNNATVQLYISTSNQTCISACQPPLFLNVVSNTCEGGCPSPYYADPSTRVCVTSCPISPQLYGLDNGRVCVEYCPTGATQYYTNNQTRMCVTACDTNYYRDHLLMSCVSSCSDPYFIEATLGDCVLDCSPKFALDVNNSCLVTCPSPYYEDSTTYKCVINCPTAPTHYKLVVGTSRTCSTSCPPGLWADLHSLACVTLCPSSPPRFADNSTWSCVSVCPYQNTGTPFSLYALNSTRSCVSQCPTDMFAQNATRTCVSQCPNGTDTYADNSLSVPACVSLCSSGLFADLVSLTCVPNCPSSPRTYSFHDSTTRICLASCPFPYVSDDSTYSCVTSCPSTLYPYLDTSTKRCVSACPENVNFFGYLPTGTTTAGNCVNHCPGGYFSDNTTRTCVPTCPSNYFAETENNTCSSSCSEINGHFADNVNHLCVPVCPYSSNYDSYGDKYTRRCVTVCNVSDFTYADPNTRLCQKECSTSVAILYKDSTSMKCVSSCPSGPPVYFADNVTMTCVLQCTFGSQRFGYIPDRSCYQVCPNGLFGNDQTRLCVIPTGCQTDFFADESTWTCVAVCPTSQSTFGDPTTHKCVTDCPPGYFRDNSTRLCVTRCPPIPNLFADNGTSNCVTHCPGGSYADNSTRVCVSNCPNSPTKTYADDSTNLCVKVCPTQPDYFSQNITWTCTAICPIPSDMYADYASRTCVYGCPSDANNTFADSQTRLCVTKCPDLPILTFNDNSTQRCKTSCTTGFADRLSKFCVAQCPNYYYGEEVTYTCVAACPIRVPKLFAEDPSRMCVTDCNVTLKLFADSYSSRCVEVCPEINATFADPISQTCVAQCPSNPLHYADSSTRTCVRQCPTVPAFFAINTTRVCVASCPPGSFADNSSRLCVAYCNTTTPMTYGDNSTWACVTQCPTNPWYFADPTTHLCVSLCPGDSYADNSTRKCVYPCTDSTTFADPTTHTCVTVCPDGYFGVNGTMRCMTGCPAGSFADVLLHLCVAKCSVDPIYYGDPLTNLCVELCPLGSISFGNPLSQECVTFNASGYSGCPLDYFSDNSTRLCVPVCPFLENTYSDNFTRMCVSTCPNSTKDTYSDNSTMRCVDLCPSMPDYYAEVTTRKCVKLCLAATSSFSGSFANNVSRRCVTQCPSTPDYYSDNSTRRCVFKCPVDPLTFADNSTRRCVTVCPDAPQDLYGDLKSRRCVLLCPEEELTYADNTTRRCERVCNATALLFGENSTNRCVRDCPNGSYADNSSRLCVAVCPDYQDTYGDSTTNTCVSQCPSGWFADPFSQTCVRQCPFVTTPISVKTYGDQFTRRCVEQCPFDKFMYADDFTHLCTDPCPQSQGTYGDDTTKRCVSQCPDVPFLYAQNITRRCNAICPNMTGGGFAENISRMCVTKCPDLTYGDPVSLYCKFYCQTGYYADDTNNTCVQQCPTNLFADNTTWRCVAVCPVSHLLFGVLLTRTCDPACPPGTYADALTQRCQTNCPGSQDTYAYDGNNTCVNECPQPLLAYNVTYVCLSPCPDPYFPNIQDHRCYRCPMECSKCLYYEMCTICISGYYLYAGKCVASCPIVPVVTYANINGTCGTSLQCSSGFFALNSTKSCVTTCPSGYYKNTVSQTCEYCMKGCSNCNNYSICLACNSLTALWDNYTCYPYCSRLQHYYYESGCATSCPDGTFYNLTFCSPCDSLCNTCALQPANCLTCADGLYLQNHLCVQTCPNNSRPAMNNGSLICQTCGTGGLDCSSPNATQLNYTINQTVENYKFKLYLTFNQKVNITGNVKDIFQIVQVGARRRLLAANSTVNYTIIDYGGGVYGFLINGFDSSLNGGLKFELQILNPTAIVSESGTIPQQTRMQVTVPQSSFYDLSTYDANFAGYAGFVTWLSLLMMLGLIWAKAEAWMPMLDLLQVLFVLYFVNMVMPPNLSYMLAACRNSFLSFLPNIFSVVLPKAVMTSRSTGALYSLIGDFLFLRTQGSILTVTLALVVFIGIMLLLTKNKKIIKDNSRRLWLKKIWKEHILGRCTHAILYLFFLPVVFYSLLQMRDYTVKYPVVGFSIFISLVYLLLFLAGLAWLLYKVISYVKKYPVTMEALAKAYNIIKASPPQMMELEENKFALEGNEIDLRSLSEPRINGKCILPFQIETHMELAALAAPFLGYFTKLAVAIFMVASFDNPLAQLLLLLAIEICRLAYHAKVQPYIYKKNKYMLKNWLAIANNASLSFILIAMTIFEIKYTQLNQADRVMLGDVACYLITLLLTYNVLFLCYRFYQQWHFKIWRPFVYSDCFKENFPIEHFAFIEEYENEKKETHKVLKKKKRQQMESVNAIQKEVAPPKLEVNMSDEKEAAESEPLGVKRNLVFLRPTQKQIIHKDIERFVNNVYDKEKSISHKNSSSLSRKDRKKMVEMIFSEKPLEKHKREEDFVQVEVRKPQPEDKEQPIHPLRMQSEDSPDEYDYEQYEEEYPEDVDMRQVLGAGYKGNVVLH